MHKMHLPTNVEVVLAEKYQPDMVQTLVLGLETRRVISRFDCSFVGVAYMSS